MITNGSCYSKCPDGFYNDNYICRKCMEGCIECTNDSICITCITDFVWNSGTSACECGNYIFEDTYEDNCVLNCPETYYGNSGSGKCEACNMIGCLECSSTSICTLCDTSVGFE